MSTLSYRLQSLKEAWLPRGSLLRSKGLWVPSRDLLGSRRPIYPRVEPFHLPGREIERSLQRPLFPESLKFLMDSYPVLIESQVIKVTAQDRPTEPSSHQITSTDSTRDTSTRLSQTPLCSKLMLTGMTTNIWWKMTWMKSVKWRSPTRSWSNSWESSKRSLSRLRRRRKGLSSRQKWPKKLVRGRCLLSIWTDSPGTLDTLSFMVPKEISVRNSKESLRIWCVKNTSSCTAHAARSMTKEIQIL